MTLIEKIRWYSRHYGRKALLIRGMEVILKVDRSTPPLSFGAYSATPHYGAPVGDKQLSDPAVLPACPAVDLIEAAHPALLPIQVYSIPSSQPRLNLVTDSIGPSSLFGGVGTALMLAALLAESRGIRLRIVTRTEEADVSAFARVLAVNRIAFTQPIEVAFCEVGNPKAQLDIGSAEEFITTSWWTTAAVLGSIPAAKVHYILQEDERMFYPHGDDWVRCNEILTRADLRYVVNTQLLYDHLLGSGLQHLEQCGEWFEPAFPDSIYGTGEEASAQKRNRKRRLFFYARPNNLRNLFLRGLETLDAALREGILDPDEWEIVFVGKDVPRVQLARGVEPTVMPTMEWQDYGAFIRGVDLGFCLMATPHPSYPPLDLAAAGAVVLTNRFGLKQDLSRYSQNIVLAGLSVPELLQGLRDATALVDDDQRRSEYRANNRLARSWTEALQPAVDFLG